MTHQEIAEYINTYRSYPSEYKGRRDFKLLATMNGEYRFDIETNTVTRLEGRVNDNGDFEIVGLFRSPIDNPEDKTPVHPLNMSQAIKTYNQIVTDYGYLDKIISEENNNTNWTLRDMVAEIDYIRSTYYDKSHVNNKLKADNPPEWNRRTHRLRGFIRNYRGYIGDRDAVTIHNSKHDRRLIMSKLKEIREAKGLSQSQLSKESGVNLRTLQYYEQGYKDINKAQAITLYRIATALECKIEDLLIFEDREVTEIRLREK